MDALIIHLTVEPMTHEVGLWCPSCLLPSGISETVAVIANGVTVLGMPTFAACADCGREL